MPDTDLEPDDTDVDQADGDREPDLPDDGTVDPLDPDEDVDEEDD